MELSYTVIIPARYASTRLPGKPLITIMGVPMIERTYRRCLESVPNEKIIIATDDERIAQQCKKMGAQYIMTPSECETGTDRIASLLDKVDTDLFINVQGDEPILDPADLTKIIQEASKGESDVVNGYSKISISDQFFSRTVPKVVFSSQGRLLYMSRNPIPINKRGEFIKAWRQICIYSFSRKALAFYGPGKKKTPLEAIEDIEILRLLENNLSIKMIELSGESLAVDVPEDVIRVENILKGQN